MEAVSTNVPASPQYMNQLLSAGMAVDTTLSAQWKTSAAGGNTSSATKSYVDLFNGISFTTPGTYHLPCQKMQEQIRIFLMIQQRMKL